VQKLVLADLNIAAHDVLHEGQDLVFWHFAPLLEEGAEISLLAVLSDDVAMGGLPDHIEASEYIGVLEPGEGLDLAI